MSVKVNYTSVSQNVDNSKDGQFIEEPIEKAPTIGHRHLQAFLYFLLGFVAFGFRVSLSINIVAMTDPSVNLNPDIPTYPHWTKQNLILSSFFWGYILPQIFAAYAAKKYGAKWFLVGTMTIQSLLSFLTPLTAAHFGEIGMMISRAMQGLCQGFIFPSCSHFLSVWIPPQERSRIGSTIYTAGKGGTLCALIITGLIAASSYGWPMAFYFFGICGVTWCILMIIFGYDTPKEHPKISYIEREYIVNSLGYTKESANLKTPWRKIFTSVHVWALVAAQTGSNYGFWTILTQIPSYMNYVMNFDMKKNSFWSAMPYLVFWILGTVFGIISDWMINKGFVSRGTARKIFNSIGLLVPAFALIALGFTRSDQAIQGVALLIIAGGLNAACFSGFAVNHVDLSPNHAGTLMGLCNAIAQNAGIIAPLMVQVFVHDVRNPLEWRNVFFLAAAVNIVTCTIYDLFGSGEIQPWNNEDSKDDK